MATLEHRVTHLEQVQRLDGQILESLSVLGSRLTLEIVGLTAEMNERFDRMEARFNQVDERFDRLEALIKEGRDA